MQPRTILLLVAVLPLVLSDPVLFERGYIKFARQGKRQVYHNVTHIDGKIVPPDKILVLVKTKSLHVLHAEAVRDLKNLQNLYLSNCGIKEIEARAFHNLPSLYFVHLEENLLKEIRKGVFNNLPVRILNLQRNEINTIAGDAFDNMRHLYKIKLNSNKLKVWDSDWFKKTPKVTELYFRRNKLRYLPPRAFASIKGLSGNSGKLFLSKNKLSTINKTSFDGLEKISQLYLDRNKIEMVSEDAFRDLVEIDVLYLARNRIAEISGKAFSKIKKIGILDLSSNVLECLPFGLVTVTNVTNLEKNNGTCACVLELEGRLREEKKTNEISFDKDFCSTQ